MLSGLFHLQSGLVGEQKPPALGEGNMVIQVKDSAHAHRCFQVLSLQLKAELQKNE